MSKTNGFSDFRFTFANQPIQGKYTLVNIYPERRVIKDEIPVLPESVAPRTIGQDFYKKRERPPFVTERDPPNEHRFNPTETLISFNTI